MASLDEPQVSYESGATALFLAVEASKWRQVIELLEQDSQQETDDTPEAAVWVCTENWRRLPLHEACRRQAPAWIVAALLASYPEAAASPNQFGELPIHLAVGCSAPPEVINLLLVSNWESINATDQSGRNPVDVLKDSEIRDVLEHETVLESLERSQETWDSLHQQHADALDSLRKEHAEGLKAIQKQHDEDLAAEQQQVMSLLARVEFLEKHVAQTAGVEMNLHNQIDRHASEKEKWAQEKNHLLQRITKLEGEIGQGTKCRLALENIVKHQQHEIQGGRKREQQLKAALLETTTRTQKDLQQHMQLTQHALQQMVDTFVDLQGNVDQQESDLVSHLDRFGIKVPKEEEKKVDPDQEEDADDEHVAAEVLAAASTVLNLE